MKKRYYIFYALVTAQILNADNLKIREIESQQAIEEQKK